MLMISVFFLFSHKSVAKKSAPGVARQSDSETVVSLVSKHILTKDPDFERLIESSGSDDDFLSHSERYRATKARIDAKVAMLNDPDLKARVSADEWAKVDKSELRLEGEDNFRAERAVALEALLSRHRSDWFEIGHLIDSGSLPLIIRPVNASPMTFSSGGSLDIDLPTLDAVYTKFHALIGTDLVGNVSQWAGNQSCAAHLRNVCKNLGGDASECSSQQKLQEIEEQLGQSGILNGCNDHPSLDEGQKIVEKQMRSDRLVLVGKGDLLEHEIQEVMIVDYNTEQVLLQMRPAVLIGALKWKFPRGRDVQMIGSSTYVRQASTNYFKDFGVTPLESQSTLLCVQEMNNTSDAPVPIPAEIVGDDSNFALTNDCADGVVPPHSSCKLTMTFTPMQVGLHKGEVHFGDRWGKQIIYLRGFGAWPWDIRR